MTYIDPDSCLQRQTLPNGLRIWCLPRYSSESVAALLVVGAGSRLENSANSGISHFLEHMLFTGSERWSAEEIRERITRQGGYWNGWTSFSETVYVTHVAAQDFGLALDWLAEVVFHPTLAADKVDRERKIIVQEKGGHDSPWLGRIEDWLEGCGLGYGLYQAIEKKLLPHSAMNLRVIGEDSSLANIDRTALLNHYQNYYVPGNTALVVVGNVQPENVFEQANELFGDLPRKARPVAPGHLPPPAGGPHKIVVRGPLRTDRVRMVLAVRTVGWTHQDRWPLQVLSRMLQKELMEELRYRRSLVYGLGVGNSMYDDTGYFTISVSSDRSKQTEILRIIEDRLQRMWQGDFDVSTLTEAKAVLHGFWARNMENTLDWAEWLADWSLLLDECMPMPDYPLSVGAVSAADVSRVVQTYFSPQRRCLALHQPIATMNSSVWTLGSLAGLGVTLWGGPRLLRRLETHRRQGIKGLPMSNIATSAAAGRAGAGELEKLVGEGPVFGVGRSGPRLHYRSRASQHTSHEHDLRRW